MWSATRLFVNAKAHFKNSLSPGQTQTARRYHLTPAKMVIKTTKGTNVDEDVETREPGCIFWWETAILGNCKTFKIELPYDQQPVR